ncbi:alpha-L-fucosidase [Gordoniibacillus kamchatkensis]|uniref:alpha-L-fucosidase n=1 Tax=Gordoniibacillus kamchatkensis TaxID=1590651 RepID=UPI0009E5CC02|nr:alpha-L-fucosidase [Paenibacillus sp. VKM B-2647]
MAVGSRPKPTARQLEFQDWEFGLFLHFGLRTFYEGYEDFDSRPMSPDKFNPAELDCDDWIRTAAAAGMKYAVLTAKHHDGFSNWPSRYSSFTVAQSPWREGRGDVVGEFVAACRRHGVKPGLYYSPYDGSADFYSQDARAYDDYFIHQITELLTGYGPIDILWFDGCGSENHEYDWPRIIGEIRRLAPDLLIFNMGDPNFRWVGNEDGIAPSNCRNVVDSTRVSILTERRESLVASVWLPAECDVQMRSTWFYSDGNAADTKSVTELMGLYELSVGRGANLLLNIGPDRSGRLPEPDASRLLEFGAAIRQRYGRPRARLADWRREGRRWVYEADAPFLLERVVLQEALEDGELVTGFTVTIVTEKSAASVLMHEGRAIGHKRIVTLPPVKARGVTVELAGDGEAEPSLRELLLFEARAAAAEAVAEAEKTAALDAAVASGAGKEA